jgi:hypothetical protein
VSRLVFWRTHQCAQKTKRIISLTDRSSGIPPHLGVDTARPHQRNQASVLHSLILNFLIPIPVPNWPGPFILPKETTQNLTRHIIQRQKSSTKLLAPPPCLEAETVTRLRQIHHTLIHFPPHKSQAHPSIYKLFNTGSNQESRFAAPFSLATGLRPPSKLSCSRRYYTVLELVPPSLSPSLPLSRPSICHLAANL